MKTRGFEVVTSFSDQNINIPQRATNKAAGYDFEAANDVVIPSIWKAGLNTTFKTLLNTVRQPDEALADEKAFKPTLVATGIKAYMGDSEFLQLANRSSNPLKRLLVLSNGIGVIDSDYYENPDNEGHIMFQLTNFGLRDVQIKKGERIGQGIFLPFLKADQDETGGQRTGGFGSSGKD
ncbi:dCTP deaminase/dUTPase family protein [Enterococcus sp. LJL90]